MKKNVLKWATLPVVALAALLMSACQNGGKATGEAGDGDSVDAETSSIVFKTFEGHFSGTLCEVNYKVAYPVGGVNKELVAGVRRWINETLGNSYTGNLADGQALVNHYLQTTKKEISVDLDGLEEEVEMYGASTSADSIYVLHQSDNYVTMVKEGYIYFSGGAHGFPCHIGVTISDKGIIGWDMFEDGSSADFQSIIEDGLREFFELDENESLSSYLIPDLTRRVPLPECPPALTPEGVMFSYGAYEIGPYSSGMPTFIVPYGRIKPLMKPELLTLLGMK